MVELSFAFDNLCHYMNLTWSRSPLPSLSPPATSTPASSRATSGSSCCCWKRRSTPTKFFFSDQATKIWAIGQKIRIKIQRKWSKNGVTEVKWKEKLATCKHDWSDSRRGREQRQGWSWDLLLQVSYHLFAESLLSINHKKELHNIDAC